MDSREACPSKKKNVKKTPHGKYLERQSMITGNIYPDQSDQEVRTP